jgi:hypothetical protein
MSQVVIYKCKNLEATSQPLLEQMEATIDSIRRQAFNIFQNRNGFGQYTAIASSPTNFLPTDRRWPSTY